jgi:2-hydroxychromene-2-carboxylate isomerase
MTPTIDCYVTTSSPWSYLGHDRFVELAREHGAVIRWKPMKLQAVFPETGGLPLAKRAPARQHYRMVELKRWREYRHLPLNLQPAHFPADPVLADCAAIALVESGADPASYLARAFRALWVYDRNIADEHTVEAVLADAGHDARAVLEKARTDAIGEIYERNSREAISRDVFGAPTYVLNGEPFWGQDRLDLLADALSSGRAPYLPG